ncbi:glycosyl transferase [Altererythrobacter sp. B11]|uniref:glycosyltransferase family 4 protein n=1 Tax=Altererythrobacter sp. B11 TaxID=2060312 RepID=UPI000DC730DB|nr:glycosyltransferase family 4 protein [Altererythrobacter sp. B11]BBC72702.1 glycosyl transferase [Altererythrobacter sp. B11]
MSSQIVRLGPAGTSVGTAGAGPARICFPFAGDVVGGSHISALGLIDRLDRSRFDPLIVVQYPGGKVARLFRDRGLPAESPFDWPEIPLNRRVGLNAFAAALRRIGPQVAFLRRNHIAIVHSNDGRTHAVWALAARLAGARLLWHHRGSPDARGLRFAAPFLADRVLAVSEFAMPRRGLLSAAGKAQVVHSPFDTDLAVNRSAARRTLLEELQVREDTLFVGYSGLFIDRKRPLHFIEIVRRMHELAPGRPVCGVMFGTAEDTAMDQAMQMRIAMAGRDGADVRIMGWRSPGTFWLAACDILLVPAVDEPFGRTLIEAQLVGTPVVATRSGGNIEALRGETGVLVAPEDIDAMAKAALALDEPARQALADRARDDARTRFGIEHHCRQVSAIYETLLAGR